MFRVIAHYPTSNRDPQVRYGGSITYEYAIRTKAQERYRVEAREIHSVELWYVEHRPTQRLNPFAWPQGC
jgi:hypothetical protein